MTTAYLGLGSNEGRRAEFLLKAVALLKKHPAIKVVARSKIYETQSVEGGGPGNFLNAVVRVETSLAARELLNAIQSVEAELGRPAPPRFGPRSIDIDILLFGDEQISTPDLQVPHPRLAYRAFVLKPLLDVLEGGWARLSEETWD